MEYLSRHVKGPATILKQRRRDRREELGKTGLVLQQLVAKEEPTEIMIAPSVKSESRSIRWRERKAKVKRVEDPAGVGIKEVCDINLPVQAVSHQRPKLAGDCEDESTSHRSSARTQTQSHITESAREVDFVLGIPLPSWGHKSNSQI